MSSVQDVNDGYATRQGILTKVRACEQLPKNISFFFFFSGKSSVVFGHLAQSSQNFEKCLETFFWPSENFRGTFGNLWKLFGNLR